MATTNTRGHRQRPTGWPVGSFATYPEAQHAVDTLSDNKFPVEHLAIVGVDLIEVESVLGRLTWGRVLGGGAAGGAWLGLFFGLLIAIFGAPIFAAILWGLIMGAIFGVIFAAVSYGVSGGQRDFTSQTQIVAGRYDVICSPEQATRARDMIAELGLATGQTPEETPRPQSGE